MRCGRSRQNLPRIEKETLVNEFLLPDLTSFKQLAIHDILTFHLVAVFRTKRGTNDKKLLFLCGHSSKMTQGDVVYADINFTQSKGKTAGELVSQMHVSGVI